MKKLLSLVLCLAVMAGLLAMLDFTVLAEPDYTTQVWKPAEITLTSAVRYKNHYTDTEIDATFTHEDGTVMTIPGFWKEAQTWAVRFAPTKEGTWTYKITCKDETNTGLHNITGTLLATKNTGNTDVDKHGFIRLSDNKRYFTYADGTPFLWIGDTNWQAPNYVQFDKCNYPGCSCGSQFKHEVDDRVAKGFTVYQTYFDTAESDGGGQRGKIAGIWKTHFTKPNTDVFNDKIDKMFAYLGEKGMTAAIGFGVHNSTMNNIKEDDFLRFVRYCVARYTCYSAAWICGQEVTNNVKTPMTGSKTVLEVYMDGSALVDQLDPYDHPSGAHMYRLTVDDTCCRQLDAQPWHNWWTLQTGHSGYLAAKSYYRDFYTNKITGTVKPILETEANYEDINCGGFNGYENARYSAWNSMMNGCVGYTYGVTGIWANCYSNERNTGWLGYETSYSYEPWFIGLSKPGSYEMTYIRRFFENLPDWSKLVPRFYDISYGDFLMKETRELMSTDDQSTIIAYFSDSSLDTGTIKKLNNDKPYTAYWYDVLTGKYILIGKDIHAENGSYTVPKRPTKSDWALVLTTEDMGTLPMETPYQDPYATDADNTIKGALIKPVAVSAIGGCYYENNKLVDQTTALYDLNGSTSWVPYADRTSQTIIYDLGKTYDVEHLTITPTKGTTIPKFRVYGSNDGNDWTILSDTSLRKDKMLSADGTYFSEKLSGQWRYVKLLLLNAVSTSAGKQEKNIEYTSNKMQGVCYTHTSIAEISVFGNETTVTPEPTAAPTEAPQATDAPADKPTKNGLPTGAVVAIIAGAAVVGAVVGIVVTTAVKKKKQ